MLNKIKSTHIWKVEAHLEQHILEVRKSISAYLKRFRYGDDMLFEI